LFLFLGKFNRTAGNNDDTVQGRKIVKIDINPYYNPVNLESDMAILWLEKVRTTAREYTLVYFVAKFMYT
jgi:hypothetical protein